MSSYFSSRDCSPLNAALYRSVLVRAPLQQQCKNRLSRKNRAMNRTKIFAILVGALNAAVSVRGQGNVEAIVTQNVRPLLPQNTRGGGVAILVRMNGKTQFFNYGFANLARNERVTADSIRESQPSTEGEPEPDGE